MPDPLTMALISAGSNVLGSALAPSPDAPTVFQPGDVTQRGDGWTVATGSASASGAPSTAGNGWIIPVVIAAAVVFGIAAWKR